MSCTLLAFLRRLSVRVVVAMSLSMLPLQQALADCEDCSVSNADKPHWKIAVGSHIADRTLTMHYERKNDPAHMVKNIGDVPQERRLRAFGLVNIDYAFNDSSAVEFEYSNNSIEDTGVIRRTTRFLGLPLRLALRIPVELTTESFKLRYAYTAFRTEDWRLAGTVGIRDFRAGVNYVHADLRKETDHHQIYLPTFGAIAGYRWDDRLSVSARFDYLPLRSKYNHGSIGDIDLAMEYRIPFGLSLGLGYRHSQISYKSNREEWLGNLTYVVSGPVLFASMQF